MKDLIQQTIELLKLRVKTNLERIKDNQLKIKEILKQPTSSDRTSKFEEQYQENKNLLAENNDFINIQLTLINFLEKYKNSDTLKFEEPVNVENIDDVFHYTVKGKIKYDPAHPYFTDNTFFERLMTYYQKNEQYEQCDRLMRLKNK
jgi:hypothetical protein